MTPQARPHGLNGVNEMRHSLNETGSERVDVLRVERVRGLVQGEDAAVLPERVREGEPDDDGREHLLPGRTAAAHVHLDLVLRHDHLEWEHAE